MSTLKENKITVQDKSQNITQLTDNQIEVIDVSGLQEASTLNFPSLNFNKKEIKNGNDQQQKEIIVRQSNSFQQVQNGQADQQKLQELQEKLHITVLKQNQKIIEQSQVGSTIPHNKTNSTLLKRQSILQQFQNQEEHNYNQPSIITEKTQNTSRFTMSDRSFADSVEDNSAIEQQESNKANAKRFIKDCFYKRESRIDLTEGH